MNLTEEQKVHYREAERQNGIVRLTWQLFTMFLSENKSPAEALQQAREAMEVWQDFDDANWMEPPDIEQPDFAEQMQRVLAQVQPIIMEILKSKPPSYPPFMMVPTPAAHPETPSPSQDQPIKKGSE